MKRFWLVMLSLGLVLAFSASAMAVDVKFSGSFFAAGMYQDKTTFRSTYEDEYDGGSVGPSTAFYYQRLRVQTDFIVSPGLKLVTRFDAMERIWGGSRSTDEHLTFDDYFASDSAGTRKENENLAFDWAYIAYTSPVGLFTVGYQNDGAWGTVFGDSSTPQGKIGWSINQGGWTVSAEIVKLLDNSKSAITDTDLTDSDFDKYQAGVIYSWKSGQAGFATTYYRYAAERGDSGYLISGFILMPYAIAQIGPVKVQAELNYGFGKQKGEFTHDGDDNTGDIKLRDLGFFLDAVADFKMFYAGGTFAYVSGDDPSTLDKIEGGMPYTFGGLNGGRDWNPTLIMFNYDRTYWAGRIYGYNGTENNMPMSNAWFYQGKVGVRPIPALDINASVSYAKADKIDTTLNISKSYGWEIDVTGTYKITNNLSYMLGGAYLFTGDYYKGAPGQAQDVENNFLLINKLTLTF